MVRAALLLGVAASVWAGEGDAYDAFNRFCIAHFAAEDEPEVHRAFGRELKVVEGSLWRRVSERSACIAWQTNLPASTFVEYGAAADFGHVTDRPERPLGTHVHYLRGLEPGQTIRYRLVMVDAEGHRHVGREETSTTPRLADAVRIPDDVQGPPYILDRPNATYLVTKDLAAGGTAIFIAAAGITLDLGGHTLTYDETRDTAGEGACGVRGHKTQGIGLKGVKVVNGFLRQGEGHSSTRKLWDTLYNPVFFSRATELELAGLTLDYGGDQVVAMALLMRGEKADVHHNVFLDRGTTLLNRHIGMDALAASSSASSVHHNLVKRTRHRGIQAFPGNEYHHNEIYVDSHATNSYGIMVYGRGGRDVAIHRNRIFGTGYHPIGIGSYQGYRDVKVVGNYIRMQATPPRGRWRGGQGGGDSPSQLHPVNGIRLQRPGPNVEHEGNVVVVKGRGEGAMMRGLWMVAGEGEPKGIVFRNNRVKLIAEDAKAEGYALSCGGAGGRSQASTILLTGNTVITNLCHVQFGDNYSHGGRYELWSNRFVKVGDDPRYRTIRLGWRGWRYETFGHVLTDTELEGGASFDSVAFDGAARGRYDFAVGWTLGLQTTPAAKVTVRDALGATQWTSRAPADGKLALPLTQYNRTREGKTLKTPHTVTVEKNGESVTKTVTMDKTRRVQIELQQ